MNLFTSAKPFISVGWFSLTVLPPVFLSGEARAKELSSTGVSGSIEYGGPPLSSPACGFVQFEIAFFVP
jgi:hypothetical protein